jgi:hypothetical protein
VSASALAAARAARHCAPKRFGDEKRTLESEPMMESRPQREAPAHPQRDVRTAQRRLACVGHAVRGNFGAAAGMVEVVGDEAEDEAFRGRAGQGAAACTERPGLKIGEVRGHGANGVCAEADACGVGEERRPEVEALGGPASASSRRRRRGPCSVRRRAGLGPGGRGQRASSGCSASGRAGRQDAVMGVSPSDRPRGGG